MTYKVVCAEQDLDDVVRVTVETKGARTVIVLSSLDVVRDGLEVALDKAVRKYEQHLDEIRGPGDGL